MAIWLTYDSWLIIMTHVGYIWHARTRHLVDGSYGKSFAVGQVSVGCFLEKSLIDYISFSVVVVGWYCSCPKCTRHNTINWIIDTKWLAICFSIHRAVFIELAIAKPNFGDPGCCQALWCQAASDRLFRHGLNLSAYKSEPFIVRLRSESSIIEMNGRIDCSAPALQGCSVASSIPGTGAYLGHKFETQFWT